MSLLPDTDRILLGPGPSLTSPRVMRAMAAPTLSHLDPQMLKLLDDVRGRLTRLFRAPEGSFACAVSGTGTSGMEAAVANLVKDGTRALVVVTGYFGDRLAQVCERYGATVRRARRRVGKSVRSRCVTHSDEDRAGRRRRDGPRGNVDRRAESSRAARGDCARARCPHDCRRRDVVRRPPAPDVGAWGIDACYSCTQKCLGAPSGLAPIVFGPRALERRVTCRSFYLDLRLLEDFWLKRKYHHTISSSLVYALYEALAIVEEEGIEARWARHERNHRALIEGLETMGLSALPPVGERLWTLNAVRVPEGADEAAVRKQSARRVQHRDWCRSGSTGW